MMKTKIATGEKRTFDSYYINRDDKAVNRSMELERLNHPILAEDGTFYKDVALHTAAQQCQTPEEYIERLREVQRTLESVKDDLDRAIDKMNRRIETGYESLEQESRLAALAGREYVKLADSKLYEIATTKIEY